MKKQTGNKKTGVIRILGLLFVVLLLPLCLPPAFATTTVCISPSAQTVAPRYDVNADGVVDICDVTLVGQHFGEETT